MVSMNTLKIPSMAIGAAGLALSAYSIVADGNMKSHCETKDELGEDYLHMYVEDLASPRESHLLEKAKHFVLEKKFDNSFHPFYVHVKHQLTSWFHETVENIVPLSLSVLALGAPLYLKAKKLGAITSIGSAGLLLLYAGKFVMHDVLGIGKHAE